MVSKGGQYDQPDGSILKDERRRYLSSLTIAFALLVMTV